MLLGITGSGKTYTAACVIEQMQKPTLIMAHNKTLAAQLYGEFKELFPENAFEYFVSYYDYYQPEAYVVSSDTYIEKDSMINEEIDRMRHSATRTLLSRRDAATANATPASGAPGSQDLPAMSAGDGEKQTPMVREAAKVGRNEPCPCGSGKKFKKCHGRRPRHSSPSAERLDVTGLPA